MRYAAIALMAVVVFAMANQVTQAQEPDTYELAVTIDPWHSDKWLRFDVCGSEHNPCGALPLYRLRELDLGIAGLWLVTDPVTNFDRTVRVLKSGDVLYVEVNGITTRAAPGVTAARVPIRRVEVDLDVGRGPDEHGFLCTTERYRDHSTGWMPVFFAGDKGCSWDEDFHDGVLLVRGKLMWNYLPETGFAEPRNIRLWIAAFDDEGNEVHRTSATSDGFLPRTHSVSRDHGWRFELRLFKATERAMTYHVKVVAIEWDVYRGGSEGPSTYRWEVPPGW